MLKLFRAHLPGAHPEAEMSRYLTSRGFRQLAPLLGEVVRIGQGGRRVTLAVAQGFVRNQGDGWTWTLDQFNRALDDLATREANEEAARRRFADYKAFAAAIGRRLGEMHVVLAGRPTTAFAPATATGADVASWLERAQALARSRFRRCSSSARLGERAGTAKPSEALLAQREEPTALAAHGLRGGRRRNR